MVLSFQKFLQNKLTVSQLGQIDRKEQNLTVDTEGRVWPISKCYENTPHLLTFLGKDAHYLDFCGNKEYFRQLAHDQPIFEDMLNFIYQMRSKGEKLPNPGKFYVELVAAKNRGSVKQSYENDKIIFTGEKFYSPNKVFISNWKNLFFESMNYWEFSFDEQGRVKSALIELGCKENPKTPEFLALLKWISVQVEIGNQLKDEWRKAAYFAYSRIPAEGLPQGATPNDKILLASNENTKKSIFTSVLMAKNDLVFFNDTEEFPSELTKIHPEIFLFDCGFENGRRFFETLEIPRITKNLEYLKDEKDYLSEPPEELTKLFKILHSNETINGIKCYLEQNKQVTKFKIESGITKVNCLKNIKYAKSIRSIYRFDGFQEPFKVDREARIIDGTLYVQSDLNEQYISLVISKAVSEEIVDWTERDAQSIVTQEISSFLAYGAKNFLKFQNYVYEESEQFIPIPMEKHPSEDSYSETETQESHNENGLKEHINSGTKTPAAPISIGPSSRHK